MIFNCIRGHAVDMQSYRARPSGDASNNRGQDTDRTTSFREQRDSLPERRPGQLDSGVVRCSYRTSHDRLKGPGSRSRPQLRSSLRVRVGSKDKSEHLRTSVLNDLPLSPVSHSRSSILSILAPGREKGAVDMQSPPSSTDTPCPELSEASVPRRNHRKSRNGCAECKRRRVKVSE